jgi:hypothetical protein
MPRGPRRDAPGALQHVLLRGIERRRIFCDDRDREDFLDRLTIQQRSAPLGDVRVLTDENEQNELLIHIGETDRSRSVKPHRGEMHSGILGFPR